MTTNVIYSGAAGNGGDFGRSGNNSTSSYQTVDGAFDNTGYAGGTGGAAGVAGAVTGSGTITFTSGFNTTRVRGSLGAGGPLFDTPGTYYFVVPAGVTSMSVSLYGAGGGGGSGWFCGDAWTGQSGGSGGYRQSYTISTTPGETLTLVVPSGGAGGYYGGGCSGVYQDGADGGTASISGNFGTVTATGGGGGAAGIVGNPATHGGAGSPNGVAGGGWTSGGCPTIAGGSNGTGYGNGGNAYCNQSGQAGANGAIIITF